MKRLLMMLLLILAGCAAEAPVEELPPVEVLPPAEETAEEPVEPVEEPGEVTSAMPVPEAETEEMIVEEEPEELPEPVKAEPIAEAAIADLMDAEGNLVGAALFVQTEQGVNIDVTIFELPAGEHGLHIHETGKCNGDFTSAGAHFNPEGKQHGLNNPQGAHAGDLPNMFVDPDGTGEYTVLSEILSLSTDSLLKESGTALIVHSGADDYVTVPTGNAGSRIACGVIQQA